jgi:Fur family ferric uptake transcriptional regulator
VSGHRRDTPQRRAIRATLADTARPLTAAELHRTAAESVPGLGIATVYRTLVALLEDGWVRQVELPGEPARYERSRTGHRHYFKCRTCGRTFSVDGCAADLEHLLPEGYTLDAHEIVLYGRCRACGERTGRA